MNDKDINTRLAEALGWRDLKRYHWEEIDGHYTNHLLALALGWEDRGPFYAIVDEDHPHLFRAMYKNKEYWANHKTQPEHWNPSEDLNQLHKYVLPEIEKRGLEWAFVRKLGVEFVQGETSIAIYGWKVLTTPANILAEAALACLRGGEG